MCRDEQRRHIHKSLVEEDNPEKVWKFLKSLGVGNAIQTTNPCNIDLNKLNTHFSTSVTINVTAELRFQNQFRALLTLTNPSFNFAQFTESDVKEDILTIDSDDVGSKILNQRNKSQDD